MGFQCLAYRRPRGVHALDQQRCLNRHQQVIGQHAQEDVRLNAVLQVMEDRAFRQRAFHCPERRLGTRECHVHQPRLLCVQVFTIGTQQITTIEQLGLDFLFQVGFMQQFPLLSIKAQAMVASHARIPLLQPADRFADDHFPDELPFVNEAAVKMEEPAKLFCYTDGLVEVIQDSGVEFGTENLEKELINNRSLEENILAIIENQKILEGSASIFDDISIIGAQFPGI